MNHDIKFGEFFGPAILVGVFGGTVYLMLVVLRVIEVGLGFVALIVAGFPLMLAPRVEEVRYRSGGLAGRDNN